MIVFFGCFKLFFQSGDFFSSSFSFWKRDKFVAFVFLAFEIVAWFAILKIVIDDDVAKKNVVVDDLLMLLTLCKKTYHLSLSYTHTHSLSRTFFLSSTRTHIVPFPLLINLSYSLFSSSLHLSLFHLSLSRSTHTHSLSQHCFRTTGQLLQLF